MARDLHKHVMRSDKECNELEKVIKFWLPLPGSDVISERIRENSDEQNLILWENVNEAVLIHEAVLITKVNSDFSRQAFHRFLKSKSLFMYSIENM